MRARPLWWGRQPGRARTRTPFPQQRLEVPMLTRTYTKTYEVLDAWAETTPWDCLIRETGCVSGTHDHAPMANQPCAIHDCGKPLVADETCYAVTNLDRLPNGHEPWVCWRHVRPDDGPIKASKRA